MSWSILPRHSEVFMCSSSLLVPAGEQMWAGNLNQNTLYGSTKRSQPNLEEKGSE